MRGLLLAVLSLALAGSALAAPAALVIQEKKPNSLSQQNADQQMFALLTYLASTGIDYHWVPEGAVTTAGVRANQLVTTQGTFTYPVVIHLCYDTDETPTNASVYDPRTLLRSSGWPTGGIHVWIHAPTGTSYNNTATDTTGANDFYGSGQALWGSLYAPGTPWTWKDLYGVPKPAVATTPRAAGLWRAVVAYGVTAASSGAFATGARPAVTNPDSLLNRSDNPDSVLAWFRAKSVGAADLARGQFFIAQNGSPIALDLTTLGRVLAMADSMRSLLGNGGDLYSNQSALPVGHSLALLAANRFGSGNLDNVTTGGGVYCPGDTCDTPYWRQGVDSVKTYREVDGTPVAITAFLDTDSLDAPANAALVNALAAVPGMSFGMQNLSGAIANTRTAASTATTSRDPMGNTAIRTLFPTTVSLSSPSCATDTGSVQCRVLVGMNKLEARFPGRVDHAIVAEEFDVTPSSWTVASAGAVVSSGTPPLLTPNLLGGQDSLAAALWSAKVRAVAFNPTYAGHNVGLAWGTLAGALTYNTNPSTFSPSEGLWPVRWGGETVGFLKHVGVRFETDQITWGWKPASHAGIVQEWLSGSLMRKFYRFDAAAYYHHTFNVATSAFGVQSNGLGGPRGNPWPQRQSLHQLRWAIHGMNAINSAAPVVNGRRKMIHRFVRMEDLNRWNAALR